MEDKIIAIFSGIILPIVTIIIPIYFKRKNKKENIVAEIPLIFYKMVRRNDINKMAENYGYEYLGELEISLSKVDREGQPGGGLILLGEIIKKDIIEGEEIVATLGIINDSDRTLEVNKIMGIEGKIISFDNRNDLVIPRKGKKLILFKNEDFIEQIWIESQLWKYSINISELKNGMNNVMNKNIIIK
ncbi:MAG: hypothetical protein ACLS9F_17685 [Clostridium paraputrificum]